jgi:hypothetical protein
MARRWLFRLESPGIRFRHGQREPAQVGPANCELAPGRLDSFAEPAQTVTRRVVTAGAAPVIRDLDRL